MVAAPNKRVHRDIICLRGSQCHRARRLEEEEPEDSPKPWRHRRRPVLPSGPHPVSPSRAPQQSAAPCTAPPTTTGWSSSTCPSHAQQPWQIHLNGTRKLLLNTQTFYEWQLWVFIVQVIYSLRSIKSVAQNERHFLWIGGSNKHWSSLPRPSKNRNSLCYGTDITSHSCLNAVGVARLFG